MLPVSLNRLSKVSMKYRSVVLPSEEMGMGAATDGSLDGSASERLILLETQAVRVVLSGCVMTPLLCRPLIAPLARRSSVPVGEGARVRFPTRLISPE